MLCVSVVAHAAPAPVPNSNALVTIRFNQPRVYYEQQLYGAVSQAVAIKPSVTFDVVSYAPAMAEGEPDSAWQAIASAHTQEVVASLERMGVPRSRLTISGRHVTGLQYDEVHITAR